MRSSTCFAIVTLFVSFIIIFNNGMMISSKKLLNDFENHNDMTWIQYAKVRLHSFKYAIISFSFCNCLIAK